MKYLTCFLLIGSLFIRPANAQEDYSFDLSEIEKKAFQFGGYLEARPVFSLLDRESRFYSLIYYDSEQKKKAMECNFKALLDLSYERGIAKAQIRLNADLNHSHSDWSQDFDLYEGYLSLKPSLHFHIDIGKKRLKWGKGYAWNPVAFIDNPKNPFDPDLALEGFTVISADYIKSFSGKLRTLTLTGILIPVFKDVNSQLGRHNTLNYGGKVYSLLFDTDIDLMFLAGPGISSRYGIDFSRNITSNIEIHGEGAYWTEYSKRVVDDESALDQKKRDGCSYLLGIRYLTKSNTTFFLEYYRNGRGYTQKEMEDYYSLIDSGYDMYLMSGIEDELDLASSFTGFRTFSPAINYLFLRILQKEPFNIVYFNPSLTSICNLGDGSFSLVPELLYTPVTDLELRARAMFLVGNRGTEFGEKQNNFRLELRIRYYF
ncbi:MAG: hypothetical protein J7L72_12445 [Candidatus Aminicenantes bacterium]|nr:hypothetical protein [Candidatus Aminicenantes bacterium]